MIGYFLKTVFKLFGFAVCFALAAFLIGLLFVEYYVPDVSFNQIVFHVLYLNKEAVSCWWGHIACILLISFIISVLMCKHRIMLFLVPILLCAVFFHPMKVSGIEVDKPISLPKQMMLSLQWSDIYEKYYQTPILKQSENKKNIIVVFAESMEDNFADEKYWGENLIPNLSKLKTEGISFEGYQPINGTNWTMASNVAALCGVPLRMQLRDRVGLETKQFLPNIKCLSDVTHEIGYHNVFSTSTYITFVGTDKFAFEHSFDEVYGRDEIILEGFAGADDAGLEEFGINDVKMFEFARQKISALAEENKPFLMTIQTLDTHFPSGYVNSGCEIKYGDTRDAIKCSDKIIYDFVRWVEAQDFYDNTMVVIAGDHLMMTAADIADKTETYPKREIYYVILEKDISPKIIQKPYAMMDFGATIADKAGVIKEGRLGLGVSLLTNKETLTEKLGAQKFEEEVLKNSVMYNAFLGINEAHKKDVSYENFALPQNKMIAHACGGIDGYVYTNSLEALNLSAERGYKYIEVDLLKLFDEQRGFFAAHDYAKFRDMTGKYEKLDRKTLKKLKILGQYTPLTDDMILDFFEKHPDIWLVTDKVDDYALLDKRLGRLKDRTIVEFWNEEEYENALKYDFKYLAYNLNKIEDISVVIEKGYRFVMVSAAFLEEYKNTLQALRLKKGVKVMVYTAENKEDVAKYADLAEMIYYDGQEKLGK